MSDYHEHPLYGYGKKINVTSTRQYWVSLIKVLIDKKFMEFLSNKQFFYLAITLLNPENPIKFFKLFNLPYFSFSFLFIPFFL